MGDVTIGFVPRERFSAAVRSLQSILENTRVPFHLIWVDCNTPLRYRQQIVSLLGGHANVEVIQTDTFKLANQAKNIVVQRNTSDYLALVENDVVVSDGWLTGLVEALENHPAGVATPLIIENGEVHYDRRIASLRAVQTPGGEKIEFIKRPGSWEEQRTAERQTTLTTEVHALLFKKEVLATIGPFDEQLTTRRAVDLTMRLYKNNIPIVFEPRSKVEFCSPPPVYRDEQAFFLMTWDEKSARWSNRRVEERWNIVDLPRSIRFARERRRWYTSHLRYRLLKLIKRVHAKSRGVKHDWKKRLQGAADGLVT